MYEYFESVLYIHALEYNTYYELVVNDLTVSYMYENTKKSMLDIDKLHKMWVVKNQHNTFLIDKIVFLDGAVE